MTNAVVYTRISTDTTGEGLGVARQAEDARELATRRGWTVVAEIEDNDTSASGKVKRPGFEQLLTGLTEGRFSVIIAWNLDRLTRNRRDTVRLIETAQAASATIALVRGSDLDLSTPAGRMTADILASVARAEIETKADRQIRANRQAAEAGKPYWRIPPFGYTVHADIVPDEAEAIRDGYARILGGQTISDVARDWNARGLLTPHGRQWRGTTVRQVLVKPTYAGRRVYRGVEYAGLWEPIVSEDVHAGVVALLTDPARAYKGSRAPVSLLAGLAVCECGGPIYTDTDNRKRPDGTRRGTRYYRCGAGKHFSTAAQPKDGAVIRATGALLAMPGAADLLHTADATDGRRAALVAERGALMARRDVELPQALAAGLSVAQVAAANRQISVRLAEVEAELADTADEGIAAVAMAIAQRTFSTSMPDLLIDQWRVWVWETLDLAAQRAVVRALWGRVTVKREGVALQPTALASRLMS